MIKRLIKRVIKRHVLGRLIKAGSCVVGGGLSAPTQPDHGNQVVWFLYRDLIKTLDHFSGDLIATQSNQVGNQVVALKLMMKV